MYLSGEYGTERIAIYLNQQEYQSPGEASWSSNAVQRLLLHVSHGCRHI
ncbi:recombinase family protein [Desulfitobacterium sp. AusDCA]